MFAKRQWQHHTYTFTAPQNRIGSVEIAFDATIREAVDGNTLVLTMLRGLRGKEFQADVKEYLAQELRGAGLFAIGKQSTHDLKCRITEVSAEWGAGWWKVLAATRMELDWKCELSNSDWDYQATAVGKAPGANFAATYDAMELAVDRAVQDLVPVLAEHLRE